MPWCSSSTHSVLPQADSQMFIKHTKMRPTDHQLPSRALAYSAPRLRRPVNVPPVLDYNAFPDLNSEDPTDRSLSGFPLNARYLLPLDSDLLLWANWKQDSELKRGELSKLGSSFAKAYREAYRTFGPNVQLQIPSEPSQTFDYRLEHTFELAHKALAVSAVKWRLRSQILAPMYTLLEDAADQGETIEVPLDPFGRGRLNRQWREAYQEFYETRPVDEAVSMYVCLARLQDPYRSLVASPWVDEEAELVENFETTYKELCSAIPLAGNASKATRQQAADEAIAWGREKLTNPKVEAVLRRVMAPRTGAARRPKTEITWPQILRRDADFPTGPLQLRTLSLRATPGRRYGLAEAVQSLLALTALKEGRSRSVARSEAWPIYVTFELDTDETGEWFIAAGASNHLIHVIQEGICRPDDVALEYEEADIIADYVVLMESIRQQICTGVGLCCPHWEPEGVAEFAAPWQPPSLENLQLFGAPRCNRLHIAVVLAMNTLPIWDDAEKSSNHQHSRKQDSAGRL